MIISEDYALRLARLLADGKLILFVGAGISRQAKPIAEASRSLPLWGELAKIVADEKGESLSDYGGDLFDLFDSIARKHGRVALEDSVRAAIPQESFEPSEAHALIAELPWQRVYTTNYDDLLKRALGEAFPIATEKDFELLTRPAERQPRLIHLHGTLKEMHTLTGSDYKSWTNKHPLAQNRIVVDGSENTLLFMGYSNSDPHFRHAILPLIHDLKTRRGARNFSWMWRPSNEQVALFLDRDYLEVHRIENDSEWVECLSLLKSCWLQLGKQKTKSNESKKKVLEQAQTDRSVRINGYKLFYYRDFGQTTRQELARKTGIPTRRIKKLETVNKNKDLSPECFKLCAVGELRALERALKPATSLEYGAADDFLAYHIEYYKNNWLQKHRNKAATVQDTFNFSPTRAVVFDFGGTLTIPQFRESTWERIWKSVGFSLQDANELHHRFSAGKIDHQEWCDLTCEKLRSAGFSISQFLEVCADIKPIEGLEDTFHALRRKNIPIHIVSGSLRAIIEKVIDRSARYVDSIRSNDMEFDSDGLLLKIIGHQYDFEGKANFIKHLASETIKCNPIDILFVGNSLNDEKAATSGARTLCVNPKHTHHHDSSIWNHTIREMVNLKEILSFV